MVNTNPVFNLTPKRQTKNHYLAMFFASLLLILSCSDPYLINTKIEQEKTSELYVETIIKDHIILAEKLGDALLNERHIDYNILQNIPDTYKTMDALKSDLREANFTQIDKISELLKNIQLNLNQLIENDSGFSSLNEVESIEMITIEIKRQMDNKLSLAPNTNRESSNCAAEYNAGTDRCQTAYAIALAALVVSAFFTFGVGTVIGAAAAGTNLLICQAAVESDFSECVANSLN